ncbi:MAG TPA: hypothetical protein VLD39_10600, partial [Gammaproteobacteria bacterium]|nr:hypothetical protein [Gammaproteobacteria bacterium]
FVALGSRRSPAADKVESEIEAERIPREYVLVAQTTPTTINREWVDRLIDSVQANETWREFDAKNDYTGALRTALNRAGVQRQTLLYDIARASGLEFDTEPVIKEGRHRVTALAESTHTLLATHSKGVTYVSSRSSTETTRAGVLVTSATPNGLMRLHLFKFVTAWQPAKAEVVPITTTYNWRAAALDVPTGKNRRFVDEQRPGVDAFRGYRAPYTMEWAARNVWSTLPRDADARVYEVELLSQMPRPEYFTTALARERTLASVTKSEEADI